MNAVRRRRGAGLIEFTFVAFTLLIVMFAAIEFARMLVVYSAVAQAARAGARYAIVHGSTRTGSGVDGPSGPGANPPEVVGVVRTYGGAGLLDANQLAVSVTYPDGTNDVGARVQVLVTYPYDSFTRLPLGGNLSSRSQGIIAF